MPGRVAIYGWSLEEVILEQLDDVRCRDWCDVDGVLLAYMVVCAGTKMKSHLMFYDILSVENPPNDFYVKSSCHVVSF